MTTGSVHPDNVLDDGSYDPRMYDLAYEPADRDKNGNRRHRVIRGLGHHIGYVVKIDWQWGIQDVNGHPVGGTWVWGARWLAAHELSHRTALAPPEADNAFRVTAKEATT